MTTLRPISRLSSATTLGLLSVAPAVLAAPDPTSGERPRIEAALRALGFERWDNIALEVGV